MNAHKVKCRGIIQHEGKLLVVDHYVPGGFHLFALPGGHLESGETPVECVERELFEELGVKPKIGRLLYINTYPEKDTTYTEFFFEVLNGSEYVGCEKLERSHAAELYEIRWISPIDEVEFRPVEFMQDFKSGKFPQNGPKFLKRSMIIN